MDPTLEDYKSVGALVAFTTRRDQEVEEMTRYIKNVLDSDYAFHYQDDESLFYILMDDPTNATFVKFAADQILNRNNSHS